MINAALSVSNKLIDMLKFFEGLHDKTKDGRIAAYLDTNTNPPKWTIGWGHTRTAKPGMVITEAQAVALKKQDLKEHEDSVKRAIPNVKLTQGQFDALVSFSYNVGANKFAKSEVVEAVNAGNFEEAKKRLAKRNRALGGKVLKGLTDRRQAEIALMNEQDVKPPQQTIAYSNAQIQATIVDPRSLWSRFRSAVGA
jgi:lysozyme